MSERGDYQSIPREQTAASTTGERATVERRPSSDSISSRDLERQGLLSPDDPRVSPLNLHKIRVIRVAIVVLCTINLVLFFGLLLNDFVSIPGLNNRGKSFLEINLIVICLITNFSTLWHFVVPSLLERTLGYVSAGLIAFNFLIILLIPYLRSQYGLTGSLIVIWTLLNILFNSLTDYWVEQGKKAQEIRLTGRAETRKTVEELVITFVKVVIKVTLLLLLFLISTNIWLNAFDSLTKPWGNMVSVDNDEFKVHLSCYGDVHNPDASPQPILLLEGGQLVSDEIFSVWVDELFQLNKIDRYCIWDRPGYGFSDSAPSPSSLSIITEYLKEALSKEKIEGPFTLVGYDIGGLYSRVFASRNIGKIESILLVDSWHEDLLLNNPFSGGKLTEKIPEIESMGPGTGFKLWLRGLTSPWGIYLNLHWIIHPRRYNSNQRIFGWDMLHQPKYIRARLQEQVTSGILSYNEVAGTDLRNIPYTVVSSDSMIKNSVNWGKWQRELTKLGANAVEWVIAENSDHEIWESSKGKVQLQNALLRLIDAKELVMEG